MLDITHGVRSWADGAMDVPLLVLNLGLDVVNGVGRLHLEGDRLPREGLDEDLHLVDVGGCEESRAGRG